MYMPEHALFFSGSQNILYRFPFMNMKMLIQEAGKQFGNVKLTENERNIILINTGNEGKKLNYILCMHRILLFEI